MKVQDFLKYYQPEYSSFHNIRITVYDIEEGTWYGTDEDEFFNKDLVLKNWGDYELKTFCFRYDEDFDVYELSLNIK